METKNSPKNEKRNGLGYTQFVLIAYAAVFLLNILNSTAFNMLLQSVSTNVRFSNTVLPHVIYYFMAVLAIVWQSVGVGVLADCIVRKKTLPSVVSAVLFFAAMMSGTLLPLIVAAFQYSSQTIISIINANYSTVVSEAIFAAVRVLLCAITCLAVMSLCAKKQKNRLQATLSACVACESLLAVFSMAVIFVCNTVPFLQSAGRNALQSQLPKIILEYVILALYGVIGYAVASVCVRISDKRY